MADTITVGQEDTFKNGTDGWVGGEEHSGGPQVKRVAGGGPSGGPFLQVASEGDNNKNETPHLATNNSGQWSGNYSAAGVGQVRFNMKNLGSSKLEMRLLLLSNLTGTSDPKKYTYYCSNQVMSVAPGADWADFTFTLAESDFHRIHGSGTFAEVLAKVTILLLRHQPDPENPGSGGTGGESVVGTLGVSSVTALAPP